MTAELQKDPKLLALLRSLDLSQRGWVTVDEWDADLCAIGIASPRNLRRLVYVSTFREENGRYFFSCEEPTGPDPTDYDTVGEGSGASFDDLLDTLVRHLDAPNGE